ncbi:hypothetical protein SDRG_02154 [Saprolegnia diclina VS20]|uniref:PH domain-containing protein n=1 Tax=Saprolegnia diclina (strain VS20) TaxID=1156394 RepID=T0R438_SAPDV|nr:hypothetical protein SDRG_02154 [Saprolegnia diclina VS20]EQC41105.1 hypothetical protein SDRG_02154 [Saprolegnia diclina VS20]|eukprot:XP_008605949.1 hypothetical protein SDRG_02154 [Saprolegnia diclina VS20]
MAAIGDVTVGFRKGANGQLHMGLELQQGNERELISKAILDQLYAAHRDLQPRVDGLFTALMHMNGAFEKHGYDGWRITSTGEVISDVASDQTVVATFNAKLQDLNGFIVHHKQRARSVSAPPTRDHRGWICKQGSVVKNWKRRFMVLQSCHLHYFETDKLTPTLKPKGSFQVLAIERASDLQHGLVAKGSGNRVFKFYADDAQSCTAWFTAIVSHLRSRPTVTPSASAPNLSSPARSLSASSASSSSSAPTPQPPRRASTAALPAPLSAPTVTPAAPQKETPASAPGPPVAKRLPIATPVSQAAAIKPPVAPTKPSPVKHLVHAPSAPSLAAPKKVDIASVLVALAKQPTGALSMSLKTTEGVTYRVVVATELNAIYAQHPRFKPLVDGLFTAMSRLNERLRSRQYSGWALTSTGTVECSYSPTEAAAFNAALQSVNQYIVRQKHAHLGRAPSTGNIAAPAPSASNNNNNNIDNVARTVAANVPVGLAANLVSVFVSEELGKAIQAVAPVLEAGQAALKEQERQESKRSAPMAAAPPRLAQVHTGIMCDGCKVTPITGPRYQSTKYATIDVCGRCVQSPAVQTTWGPFQEMRQTVVHPNVACDGCGTNPIAGTRFISKKTPNFDCCERCVGRLHTAHGPFDAVARPRVLTTHINITCDGCRLGPIRGARFASTRVANFDLCHMCTRSRRFEASHGPFRRVGNRNEKNERGETVTIEVQTGGPARDMSESNHYDDYDDDEGMYESNDGTFAGDDGSNFAGGDLFAGDSGVNGVDTSGAFGFENAMGYADDSGGASSMFSQLGLDNNSVDVSSWFDVSNFSYDF